MRASNDITSFALFLLVLAIVDNVDCVRGPAFLRSGAELPNRRRVAPIGGFGGLQAANGEERQIASYPMDQNGLMHAMLRVPDVNATIDFWKDRSANVHSYRKTAKAETAFLGFGPSVGRGYFSLEVTKLPDDTPLELGDAIRYIGLSMLLGMDLKMAATGEKAPSIVDTDPNGIEVRPVASAPGDSFSRLCLATSTDEEILSKIAEFYENLGMQVVAADDDLLCLRYTSPREGRTGVATTLVFEKLTNTQLVMGNCLDHFAISTANVYAAAEALRSLVDNPDDVIFMEPKPMFGTTIMGLCDPNGYKVYLVEETTNGESQQL